MQEEPSSVEEKIIVATIGCINELGMAGATNREIARRADVNIAAINYYFRNKEVLMQKCQEITLKNGFDLANAPETPGAAWRQRCVTILLSMMEGGLRYRGLARAHFYAVVVDGQPDPLLEKAINTYVDEIIQDLGSHAVDQPEAALRLMVAQWVSAAIFAVLAPDLFARQHGLDLNTIEGCRAYLQAMIL